MVNVVWGVPSPQSTSTVQGLSAAVSLSVPRLKDAGTPSLAVAMPGARMSGDCVTATFGPNSEVEPPTVAVAVSTEPTPTPAGTGIVNVKISVWSPPSAALL